MKLAEMEPVLARVAAWTFDQPRDPLSEFSAFVRASLAAPSEVPQIEGRLLRMLAPDAAVTDACREYVCRELSLIGTSASVPVLARLLTGGAMSEMARYTLARIPGPEAADALRGALPSAPPTAQGGIANALGDRGDRKAIPALKKIASAKSPASDCARAALAHLGSGGRPASAKMARVAALHDLAVPALEKELDSPDAEIQAAAIRLLSRAPREEAIAIYRKHYAALSPIGQFRVLYALGDLGDPAARPPVLDAAKSATPEIRAAALAALGKVGDGSSVGLLADAAANDAQPAEQAAARESLAMLNRAGVDEAIGAAIESSSGKVRLELMRAAGERASRPCAPALLRIAQGSDAESALAAIRALRNAAGPEQAPALLDAVIRIRTTSLRREAATSLAYVIRRSRQPEIGPVLAAAESADKPARLVLIDVMGQVSSPDALPVLRAALKDSDPEVARAAILALSAWQTPAPLPDLLAAARTQPNATLQILGLRGYIKLIAVPAERTPEQSIALWKDAWPLAKLQAEKRSLLALLPLYPTSESLRLADAAIADAAVAKEAKAAAETLRGLGVK